MKLGYTSPTIVFTYQYCEKYKYCMTYPVPGWLTGSKLYKRKLEREQSNVKINIFMHNILTKPCDTWGHNGAGSPPKVKVLWLC